MKIMVNLSQDIHNKFPCLYIVMYNKDLDCSPPNNANSASWNLNLNYFFSVVTPTTTLLTCEIEGKKEKKKIISQFWGLLI